MHRKLGFPMMGDYKDAKICVYVCHYETKKMREMRQIDENALLSRDNLKNVLYNTPKGHSMKT